MSKSFSSFSLSEAPGEEDVPEQVLPKSRMGGHSGGSEDVEAALLISGKRSFCQLCPGGHVVDVGGAVVLLSVLLQLSGHPVHLGMVVVSMLALPIVSVCRPSSVDDGGGGHAGVGDELPAPGARVELLAPLWPLPAISPGLVEMFLKLQTLAVLWPF